ncbi:hypothetical protein Y1Q_0014474 [Alligator mississippiensis]|uniref:Uncharacterized protein n=1 Tax=Alligator mississippiensis TaxID=8496 RepID=A0A151PCR2_ALLMI|nr:hypothetical protein Y1Q_0014474 [Alligator mississippiensis]
MPVLAMCFCSAQEQRYLKGSRETAFGDLWINYWNFTSKMYQKIPVKCQILEKFGKMKEETLLHCYKQSNMLTRFTSNA